MPVNSSFWRDLRDDFETLKQHKFGLNWSSALDAHVLTGELASSQWEWFWYPDDSLRVRLEAIATRGATALGLDSKYDWFDRIRLSGFVHSDFQGIGSSTRVDGRVIHSESASLDDVVKHSITLCHKLEAESVSSGETAQISEADYRRREFWRNLKAHFLDIRDVDLLSASFDLISGDWSILADLPDDNEARRAEFAFETVASRAAIALPIDGDRDPVQAWLDRLRDHGAHPSQVLATDGQSELLPTESNGCVIRQVALASAEYCDVLATSALKAEVPARAALKDGALSTGTMIAKLPHEARVHTEAGQDTNGSGWRAAVDAYIQEVYSQTGKRITRTAIWKEARYKTRTEFERWQRNDSRATKTAHQRFTHILTHKPHLR